MFLHNIVHFTCIIKVTLKTEEEDNIYHTTALLIIVFLRPHFSRAAVPLISPLALSSSSFRLVSSSRARMSAMVIPCHLSVQQNSCNE